jgi:hypothetical protein
LYPRRESINLVRAKKHYQGVAPTGASGGWESSSRAKSTEDGRRIGLRLFIIVGTSKAFKKDAH